MIRVSVDGLDTVAATFGALPDQAERASKRAIRKATRSLASRIGRGLAKTHGIPLKAVKSRRRVIVSRTTPGLVWVGYNPIAAIYLGNARQLKTGVRIGSRRYDGAFLATMKSGHFGVFRRRGKSRLPIEEVKEPLTQTLAVIQTEKVSLEERLLPQIYLQELNYEINVRR